LKDAFGEFGLRAGEPMRLSFSTKTSLIAALVIALSIAPYVFVQITFGVNRRTREIIEEKRNGGEK